MNEPFKVYWTERSITNAQLIKKYLRKNFSGREVESFERILGEFENAIEVFPRLYPTSRQHPELRRAVLNKFLSVYYFFDGTKVVVIAMSDNRQENLNTI